MTNLATEKPPYSIASMEEIKAIPWNGLNVVSTFSGCGGTCLGYKMAGFKILWASEFIPAAQEVYRLNHPDTILDTQDIRQVTGETILNRIGLRQGEVDVLEGSPPCASFSTSGRREHYWGQVVSYSDTRQRVDDLFDEFIRIVNEVQPKVFVAENVSGLVKGVAKGYFKGILARMRQLNYRVETRLINAVWLGVPQSRERLFFLGVRNDLDKQPAFPKPLSYYYTLGEIFPYIKQVKKGGTPNNFDGGGWVESETDIARYAIGAEWEKLKQGGHSDKYFNLQRPSLHRPSPTVTASGGNTSSASVTHPTEKRKFSIAELKQVCSFPDDFQLTGTFEKQWERLGRSVPPLMAKAIAETIHRKILGGYHAN